MLFSTYQKFSDKEIDLIQGLLEKLMGKDEEFCQKMIQKESFILLDKWNKKMGFVKEEKNRYLILSLYFKNSKCHFYQVITKDPVKNGWTAKFLILNWSERWGSYLTNASFTQILQEAVSPSF